MNLSRSIAIHSKHSEVLESLLEKKKSRWHIPCLTTAACTFRSRCNFHKKFQNSRFFLPLQTLWFCLSQLNKHGWCSATPVNSDNHICSNFILYLFYSYSRITCNTGPKPISNGYTEWNLTGWNASICTPRCVYRSWEVISVDCMPTCSVDKKKENMLWTA